MSDDAAKTPAPAQAEPGYGDMTRAWLDAGPEIAEYEAGKAAEKRRLMMVGAALLLVAGAGFALLSML